MKHVTKQKPKSKKPKKITIKQSKKQKSLKQLYSKKTNLNKKPKSQKKNSTMRPKPTSKPYNKKSTKPKKITAKSNIQIIRDLAKTMKI